VRTIRSLPRAMVRRLSISAALVIGVIQSAFAGDALLRNGDHITGKILSLAGGELIVKSSLAGELTIAVKNVKTFSSDEAVTIRIRDEHPFESRINTGPDGKIEVRRSPASAPELVAVTDVTEINPSAPSWAGETRRTASATSMRLTSAR